MSLLTESDTSPLRGIILGVVIKLVKVISVMLLVGLPVGLIYSKVKDYQKGKKKTDPVIDTATDTVVDTTTADPVAADTVAADTVAADTVTGPCLPSNSCREVGSRQPGGNCPSETNKDDGTLCGLAGSSCRGGQCVADCAGSWSDWSACSVSCGVGGIQTKSYNVTTQPSSGGTPCPEQESQGCNTQPCLIQCTSPSVKTGYNVTSETLDAPSNFSVTVACDTGYHGTPSSTCGAGGGPYTLSGCDVNPTCQGYDCSGSANTINPNPDSIICAGSTCQDTECCTVAPPAPVVPSCTLPGAAETGYIYGFNKAVTGNGPDTTDITCDASQGWYLPSGSVIGANCAVSENEYRLNGCVQGCKKPSPSSRNMVGYNLPENSTSPVGSGLPLTGGTCSYSSDTPTVQCDSPGSVYVPQGCDTTPTCTPSICDPNTTAISPSPLCLDDPCTPQECCTAVTPTCTTPNDDGYLLDNALNLSMGDTAGAICNEEHGYRLSGVISVSCLSEGADYTLSGCNKGCLKPVAGNVPEYNLSGAPNWLADETLESPLLLAADCIAGYVGTPVATCNVDNANTIDYYTVDGCAAPAAPAVGSGSGQCVDDSSFITEIGQTCGDISIYLTGVTAGQPADAAALLRNFVCPLAPRHSDGIYWGSTDTSIAARAPPGQTGNSSFGAFTVGAGDACKATCGTCPDSLPVEPVTQATALPACADIMVSGVVPSGSAGNSVGETGMSETQCINLCSSQADCKSVSYRGYGHRCYTYNGEYEQTIPSGYNYYPEKCQP
jgi:hypothetical protein